MIITSKELKRYWHQMVRGGHFVGSYMAFLREEAKRASPHPEIRKDGSTYADAAFLLLDRK